MFEEFDGFVTFETPSAIEAAAINVAVGSTKQVERLETQDLLDQAQLQEVLVAVKTAKAAYRPPGQ